MNSVNKALHRSGVIVAASIPLFVLPARISEGQLSDPVNLIGSEIVIFLMCLTCWYAIHFIQQHARGMLSILLCLLCCCFFSNVFYFTFNPFFKDFPFRTPEKNLLIKIAMLSSRGVLMSVILIPASYYLKRDREARFQRQENERLALEKVRIQNRMLEQAVAERTKALFEALGSLELSQRELQHQLYIQSRLVASITHDIGGPFNYLIIVSQTITDLMSNQQYETAQLYSQKLLKSLQTMSGFVKNLLEFTKLPVQQKLSKIEQISLYDLLKQKSDLFEGIIKNNNNALLVEADPGIQIKTNPNLVSVVIHNLIDNANKHMEHGSIVLKTVLSDSHVKLQCINTGRQVPPYLVTWVNSDFASNNQELPWEHAENNGIGLILVKEITRLLDIGLNMQSNHQATTVTLTFTL